MPTLNRRFPRLARRTPASRSGLTLLEVLIVVGVIGILVGLVINAIARFRTQSRTTLCLAQLREIGLGALVYASRYNQHTIPGYRDPKTAPGGNTQGADVESYATVLVNEKIVEAPDVQNVEGGIQTVRSVFRCPDGNDDLPWEQFTNAKGDNPEPEGKDDERNARAMRVVSVRSGKVIDTWYGVNLRTDALTAPCRRLPTAGVGNAQWDLPRYNDLPDPARMVFLYDGVFFNLHHDSDRISARHNNKTETNLLFFDGHSETFKTKDLPGGMGPNKSGENDFDPKKLVQEGKTEIIWRLDQPAR